MSTTHDTPGGVLRQAVGGYLNTQVLYTAAKLQIADYLKDGPKHVSELASRAHVSPQALCRFLRMLVVMDLLSQEGNDTFGLTPVGDYLRSDHPESMRDRLIYVGEVSYKMAQGMLRAIQTGEPAFEHVFGMPFFEYFDQHPDMGALFNGLMSRGVNDRIAGIVAAYDFSAARTIVDVGGGVGTLVAAILSANPHVQGIVFDVPKVAATARSYLAENGVAERCQVVAGNFFMDAVPKGGDIYLMSNIIHDWNDEQALHILRNCRSAMGDAGTLLLIEELVPIRVDEARATIIRDLNMLLLTPGRERTEAEYGALLNAAGLEISSVIPFNMANTYGSKRPNWVIMECKPRMKR
jgi:hypothetical protein